MGRGCHCDLTLAIGGHERRRSDCRSQLRLILIVTVTTRTQRQRRSDHNTRRECGPPWIRPEILQENALISATLRSLLSGLPSSVRLRSRLDQNIASASGSASITTSRQSPQPARCSSSDSRSLAASDCSAKAVSRSASGCLSSPLLPARVGPPQPAGAYSRFLELLSLCNFARRFSRRPRRLTLALEPYYRGTFLCRNLASTATVNSAPCRARRSPKLPPPGHG